MKQLANKAASGDRHAVKQLIELDRSIGERSLRGKHSHAGHGRS